MPCEIAKGSVTIYMAIINLVYVIISAYIVMVTYIYMVGVM